MSQKPVKHLRAVRRMISAMAREHELLARGLRVDTWGYRRVWMVGPVRRTGIIGLPVRTWTHKYLTALSLGPWRIARQAHQKNALISRVGDTEWSTLSTKTVESLPFSLPWQRSQTRAFHTNLRKLDWTLDELCARLRHLSGEGAYSVLATLSEVRGYSKCLDFFVREALRLDTIPVDRHVRKVLKRFGLDKVPPAQMAYLIEQAGYKPRLVARVLYEQGL